MRILMPVSFVAEAGGLHDHVEEIALAARRFGFTTVVAGRAGAFLDRLAAAGVETIAVDFSLPGAALSKLASAGPWDLIHTHPFEARAFACLAAEAWCVPLIVTIHGWYLDDLPSWHVRADAVIAVTGAIADRLKRLPGIEAEKIVQINNHLKATGTRRRLSQGQPSVLSVASRIDRDFGPVQTILDEFVDELVRHEDRNWRIEIAGGGTGLHDAIKHVAVRWNGPFAPPVSFLGWLQGEALSALYARSSATIAPGRSAVDAIGFGIPTIMTRQIGTYALAPVGDTAALLYGTEGARVSGRDLYAACRTFEQDTDYAFSVSESHRRIARLNFDPLSLSRRLAGVYEAALLNRLAREAAAESR
jgi:glycosyltransferase involved in cell wall biosynthesis